MRSFCRPKPGLCRHVWHCGSTPLNKGHHHLRHSSSEHPLIQSSVSPRPRQLDFSTPLTVFPFPFDLPLFTQNPRRRHVSLVYPSSVVLHFLTSPPMPHLPGQNLMTHTFLVVARQPIPLLLAEALGRTPRPLTSKHKLMTLSTSCETISPRL